MEKAECTITKEQKLIIESQWKKLVLVWLPDLLCTTYFVPPAHFNKLKLTRVTLECKQNSVKHGETYKSQRRTSEVIQQDETQFSDLRDDRAQLTILDNLHKLAEGRQPKEVMVVFSNFSLDNYMNKTLTGGRRKKRKRSDDPSQLPENIFPVPSKHLDPSLQRGDFDIFIIHKDAGFIVMEVKAFGDDAIENDHNNVGEEVGAEGVNTTVSDDDKKDFHKTLKEKVMEALGQLDKLRKALEHIISDMVDVDVVQKRLLALPNVHRKCLQKVVEEDEEVKQVSFTHICL